jgi:hypothetical protein
VGFHPFIIVDELSQGGLPHPANAKNWQDRNIAGVVGGLMSRSVGTASTVNFKSLGGLDVDVPTSWPGASFRP